MSHSSDTQKIITAYALPGTTNEVTDRIRPCQVTRDWMDATPSRYAYRCIPLSAANSMGWEILNTVDTTIKWTGIEDGDQLIINTEKHDPFSARPHFGSGTVTFYIPFLFRTRSDYGLLVSGPANHDKAGITPLDAFIRTDWVPFPFTMNWRITEPGKEIKFKAGEPICRIMPYPIELLNESKVEIREFDEDPEFTKRVSAWEQQRQASYQAQKHAESEWDRTGKLPDLSDLWKSQYAKGIGSEVSTTPHQNIFKCAPPENHRKTKL